MDPPSGGKGREETNGKGWGMRSRAGCGSHSRGSLVSLLSPDCSFFRSLMASFPWPWTLSSFHSYSRYSLGTYYMQQGAGDAMVTSPDIPALTELTFQLLRQVQKK